MLSRINQISLLDIRNIIDFHYIVCFEYIKILTCLEVVRLLKYSLRGMGDYLRIELIEPIPL